MKTIFNPKNALAVHKHARLVLDQMQIDNVRAVLMDSTLILRTTRGNLVIVEFL